MDEPHRRSKRWRAPVLGLAWLAVAGGAVAAGGLQWQLARHHPGLALAPVSLAVFASALASAGTVGTALVLRRHGHPAGWAFVALAVAMAAGPALDLYGRLGAVAEPGRLPGAAGVAHASDPFFLAYFVAVAVALHLTPTGRPLSGRWAVGLGATVAGGAVGFVGGLLNAEPIDPPFERVANPLAPAALQPVWRGAWLVGPNLAGLGLVLAAASLIVRFVRARGAARRQLLWMSLVAAPLPIFIAIVFAHRNDSSDAPLLLATGGFIVLVPVAAGLSISRYHLYDVDRILSRTFTWVLLSVAVVALYASTVALVGDLVGGWARTSRLPAILGTLAAATAAAPARRLIQDGLDRQFNRRRYDALAVVRSELGSAHPAAPVDDVLRRAVGDPGLAVSYWIDDRAQWVTTDGLAVDAAPDGLVVSRDGSPVAQLVSGPAARPGSPAGVAPPAGAASPAGTDEVLAAAARAAVVELDNARLRAALALQLAEVRASRSRIAAAQAEERRRIERNLHDGAQQRLLALAFDLRAAQLNGDPDRLRSAVAHGVEQAQATLAELRDLAHGLNPPVLADGGLAAALDDLTSRLPMVQGRCPDRRFPPEVESAAWFAISEAVANALKHAGAAHVVVEVGTAAPVGADGGPHLTATVGDDGCGGVDLAAGSGLQGLCDRIEAAGGTVDIDSPPGAGTRLTVRLPCGR